MENGALNMYSAIIQVMYQITYQKGEKEKDIPRFSELYTCLHLGIFSFCDRALMDSHGSISQTSLLNYSENNGSSPLNPQPLNVAPFSCVPHTGPPLSCDYHASPSPDICTGSVSDETDSTPSSKHVNSQQPAGSQPAMLFGSASDKADSTPSSKHVNSQQPAGSQPAMLFFTACPARAEWDNLINYANDEVALTGSALLGKVGPLIGSVDIAESEDDYVFRVSLPGVARDEKVFRCDGGPNGRILIKGVSMTGESTVCRDNMVFKMQTQNLCPPGEFSVSFQLPGPIDHQNLNCVFGSDGIFEVVVKKK